MTRPKRWYLAEDADKAVVLKNNDGLIKKPNAARPLGKVLTVSSAVTTCSFRITLLPFIGNQRR